MRIILHENECILAPIVQIWNTKIDAVIETFSVNDMSIQHEHDNNQKLSSQKIQMIISIHWLA